MFNFKSKPVQIASSKVLCQDGSIWHYDENHQEFKKIAEYKKTGKSPVKGVRGSEIIYTEEFEYMWSLWKDNIKFPSNKKASALAFEKLSNDERTALCYSIAPYAKTQPEDKHQFLKRCESYINSSHWESVSSFKEVAKNTIPPMSDAAWNKQIENPNTGITDVARDQVERFGLSKTVAWGLINDT